MNTQNDNHIIDRATREVTDKYNEEISRVCEEK